MPGQDPSDSEPAEKLRVAQPEAAGNLLVLLHGTELTSSTSSIVKLANQKGGETYLVREGEEEKGK